jgi:hypothetical protein
MPLHMGTPNITILLERWNTRTIKAVTGYHQGKPLTDWIDAREQVRYRYHKDDSVGINKAHA